MAGGGGGGSSPARLALLLVAAAAAAVVACGGKVVHVEETHRRSMLANGLGSAPPMGWNSWNHFQCDGNGEVVIRETADALVSTGLAALGYRYVNIGALVVSRMIAGQSHNVMLRGIWWPTPRRSRTGSRRWRITSTARGSSSGSTPTPGSIPAPRPSPGPSATRSRTPRPSRHGEWITSSTTTVTTATSSRWRGTRR